MSQDTLRIFAVVLVAVSSACEPTPLPTAVTDAAAEVLGDAPVNLRRNTILTIRQDLGTLGGTISSANDINNLNQVTGSSFTADLGTVGIRAFLWSSQTGMIDINDAAATNIARFGNALNDAGQIAAFGEVSTRFGWAALRASPPYPSNSLDLGKLGGIDGFAYGINSAGTVVGSSENPALHPFIWVAPGPMQDLGSLGGNFGEAFDVNDAGTVVGVSTVPGGKFRAFSWSANGGMVNLGTLGGDASAALAINQAGDIVGWANTSQGAQHAARWAGVGNPIDLGTFVGGSTSRAADINNLGAIAGSSTNSVGDQLAALWTPTGALKALLPITGGKNSDANGINDAGHVAGVSDVSGGGQHAVVWWNYRLPDVRVCICRLVLSRIPFAVAVEIYGTPRFDVRSLEAELFTLGVGLDVGDAQGVPLFQEEGRPVYEIRDGSRDGIPDLVLYFDRDELARRMKVERTPPVLTLLGVMRDRSKAVIGTIPLRRTR